MLGWLWIFSIFSFNLGVLTVLIYWQSENASKLALFGLNFKSIWTFWLAYVIVSSPIYILVNYLFSYGYWYGYNKLFPGEMWRVVETQWLASIAVTFLITWLYLGELPARNAIIALVFLIGALIAILWK